MTKLNTILSQIEKLKASLSQINPAAEDVPNRYWQDKLLLSQLYEKAGDLYLANKDYLLALNAYCQGRGVVTTESLKRKLNSCMEKQSILGEFPAVTTGDQDSLYLLGAQYQAGMGVPINYEAAFYYFSLAANLGNASAQNNLGCMYAMGHGVEQSDTDAFVWFRKAAEQGHATGQFNLGGVYATGQGVVLSETEAVMWYRKSIQQGHPYAQFNLGLMYAHGQGVPQNDSEALVLYRRSEQQGCLDAKSNINWMYKHSRGPTDLGQAKHYRLDLQREAPFSLNMLMLCKNTNPDDIETQYHVFMAYLETSIKMLCSYADFYKLYQKDSFELVKAVLSDDLIQEETRCELLETLLKYAQTNKLAIEDDLLMWLGNYYFEQLPKLCKNPSDKIPAAQKACAKKAIQAFEQIPADSENYDEAADAIVLMRCAFEAIPFEELNQNYFTDKQKQPFFKRDFLASVEIQSKREDNYIHENLQKYAASPASKYAEKVKELISANTSIEYTVNGLNAMVIESGDELYALREEARTRLQTKVRGQEITAGTSDLIEEFSIWQKQAATSLTNKAATSSNKSVSECELKEISHSVLAV